MRVGSMAELRKLVSPDVIIEDDSQPPTELNKQLRKADKEATDTLEKQFLRLWLELGGRPLEDQVVFHHTRKWRFDFGEPDTMVAFEIQGGIYAEQSGHRSFEGVQRDYEKLNAAIIEGWKVFQVTSLMMQDRDYIKSLVDFVDEIWDALFT